MSSLPTIPDPANARLPVTYEAAQKALAECQRVDEVKDWADKAAALAAYARMAKNDNLRLMALRIQERATRRMGELLKQIPSGSAANLVQHRQDGGVPSVTRTQVAGDAGLSERQRKTALRLASIPKDQFEAAVESGSPPTLSAMANWGTLPRKMAETTPEEAQLARRARDLLREFAAFCGAHDPVRVAFAMRDPGGCRGNVETIDAWLDRFVTNLESENKAA